MPLLFHAFEKCFVSNSVFITSRSFTAPQALLQLQDILAHCSDGKNSNNEIDNALDNNLEEVQLDSSGEESDVNSASEQNKNDPQNQVKVNQDLIVKDERAWQALATPHSQIGHLQ